MTSSDDEEFAGIVEVRTNIAAIGGKLCEARQNIELRDRGCGTAQTGGFGGDAGTNLDEELTFDFQDALVGGENFTFVILQFR